MKTIVEHRIDRVLEQFISMYEPAGTSELMAFPAGTSEVWSPDNTWSVYEFKNAEVEHGHHVLRPNSTEYKAWEAAKLSAYEKVVEVLGEFGIEAHVIEKNRVIVKRDDPEIEAKLQALLLAKKADIAASYDAKLQSWGDPRALTFYGTSKENAQFLEDNPDFIPYAMKHIPLNSDGTVLDPEQAAKMIAYQQQALTALSKQLGVGKMVEALSPRTGRVRDAGGDDAA